MYWPLQFCIQDLNILILCSFLTVRVLKYLKQQSMTPVAESSADYIFFRGMQIWCSSVLQRKKLHYLFTLLNLPSLELLKHDMKECSILFLERFIYLFFLLPVFHTCSEK